MSNRNTQNPNPNNGANNGGTPDNGGKKEEKKTLATRIMKARDKVMASKAGRLAVKGLKVLGLGGVAYFSFKAGAKSVKPTTIYIREGVTEEEEPEDEPTETQEPETEEE